MNLLHTIGTGLATIGIFVAGMFGYTPETVNAPQPAPQEEELGRAVNPVASKTYTLFGGGISSSANTITLSSFKIPVSDLPFNMSHFGDGVNATGYLTIEPGSATKQEFVSFTGITQNGDGTATLTGVQRGLAPVYPYTASTTYAKSHAGGSVVTVSNPPQLYEAIYSYIDNATTSGAVDGTVTAKGLYETATGIEAASTTGIGGGNTTATLALTTLISTSTAGTAYTIPVTNSSGKLDASFCCSGTTTFTIPPVGTVRVTEFTSSTTYTKPSNLKYIDLQMWGAGGAGESNSTAAAGGGAGGEYKFVRIKADTLSATTFINIGSGGLTAADGLPGGNTSFGNLVAYGGAGATNGNIGGTGFGGFPLGNGSTTIQGTTSAAICGILGSCPAQLGRTATSTVDYGGGASAADASGVGHAANSVNGGAGGGGARSGVTANAGISLNGGNGGAGAASGNASNGSVPGGGGGGAFNGTGGNGGNGMVRITEYY